MRKERQHGTRAMYQKGKCRCAECKAANSASDIQSFAKRKALAQAGNLPEGVTHGLDGYLNWGCKCDACGEAMRISNAERYCTCEKCRGKKAALMAKRNDETRATARRNGVEWTGPELEVVARNDLPLREMAKMLGRTYSAVARQRALLRRDPRTQILLGAATNQEAPTATRKEN